MESTAITAGENKAWKKGGFFRRRSAAELWRELSSIPRPPL
jgi:hypothetical protein